MIAGDTKILTVYDGKVKIKDLENQGEILVYSWNPDTKLPTVSIMSNVVKSAELLESHELAFDSGLKVICSWDQEFYAFRGYKLTVTEISPNQSIRAFSLSIHRDGHLRAHGWVNGKAKHQYVARMVWEYFNGEIEDDLILHHKDFDKLNNRLENFELLTNSQHNYVHYPFRRDGGFFRKNHKAIYTKSSFPISMYDCQVDRTNTFIIPDDEAISGVDSGIVACCGTEVNFD